MKKLVLMFVVLFSMSTSLFADGLTATLQQGDLMTPFYGVDAFKNAYAAAQDGDVITLSSGQFNDVLIIEKRITIIGAYAFDVTNPMTTILSSITISHNDVKVEGIYFNGIFNLNEVSNTHIKRCWIRNLYSSANNHISTLVEQCVIESDKAVATGINYCIKNSTINSFHAMNTTNNPARIENCVIWKWNYNNMYDEGITQPYALYLHNVLCGLLVSNHLYFSVSMKFSAPYEFYYNLFINTINYDAKEYVFSASFDYSCLNEGNISGKNFKDYYNFKDLHTYPAKDMKEGCVVLGMDDMPIGIKGGGGFHEFPGIPRVLSREIDSKTDAEGKINVKITVKAEQ